MKTFKTFETERLLIRPTHIDDADFILQLLNTPKWMEFIGDRNVKDADDAKKYTEVKMLPQLKQLGYSNNTVILKSTQEKIGICGLYSKNSLEHLEIGFAFLPNFEKKGYGFESANRVIAFGFQELNMKSVSGITSLNNVASQKLLLKLGFYFDKKTLLPDESEEVMVFKKVNEVL